MSIHESQGLSLGQNEPRPANPNPEWLYRQACRLAKNSQAIRWLLDVIGISFANVKYFGLGLTPPSKARRFTDALCFPVMDNSGAFLPHYIYFNVPGVTRWAENTSPLDTWSTKPVQLYHAGVAGKKQIALLVSDPAELWLAKTIIDADRDLSEKIHLFTCTHSLRNFAQAPEVQNPQFWMKFKRIIVSCSIDATDRELVDPVLQYARRGIFIMPRVSQSLKELGCSGKGKSDVIAKDAALALRHLVDAAKPYSYDFRLQGDGRGERIEEVDAQSLYHKGFLYYAFEQLIQGTVNGEAAEEFQPLVIKSDGSILRVIQLPQLSGKGRGVLRLTDGTLLSRVPKCPRIGDASWEASSIMEFSDAKCNNKQPPCSTINVLIRLIIGHLKAVIWLPQMEDYTVLAFVIVTSYVQEIFSAVPLLLVVGPPGSGKTLLAEEAAKLGCNGKALGRTTIVGLMEAADSCRGLLTIDDLEEVASTAKRRGQTVSTNAYQQVLKQSYKKSSGTQIRMQSGSGLASRNLYGVKIFNNTKGVDPITASRLFTVHTEKRTEMAKSQMQSLIAQILGESEIRRLRNELHIWAFSSVDDIAKQYKKIMSDGVAREDEISAPLKTIATLANEKALTDQLDIALSKRNGRANYNEEKAFQESVRRIVLEGYTSICAPQVINEICKTLGPSWILDNSAFAQTWRKMSYVANRLVQDGWVLPSASRIRINHEIKTRLYTYTVCPERLKAVCEISTINNEKCNSTRDVHAFCSGCSCCKYNGRCSIQGFQAHIM